MNTFRMKKWQYKYQLKIFASIFLAENPENDDTDKKEKMEITQSKKIKRL